MAKFPCWMKAESKRGQTAPVRVSVRWWAVPLVWLYVQARRRHA